MTARMKWVLWTVGLVLLIVLVIGALSLYSQSKLEPPMAELNGEAAAPAAPAGPITVPTEALPDLCKSPNPPEWCRP